MMTNTGAKEGFGRGHSMTTRRQKQNLNRQNLNTNIQKIKQLYYRKKEEKATPKGDDLDGEANMCRFEPLQSVTGINEIGNRYIEKK